MTVNVGDTWYRYEAKSYSVTVDPELERYATRRELECRTFTVIKVTPKGVRLNDDRVVLHHTIKRFAHPTKALALEAYVSRKEKQIDILKRQLRQAESDMQRAVFADPS